MDGLEDANTVDEAAAQRLTEEAAAQRLAENNALARVFDDVARQSAQSELVSPNRWVELGFVPEHMTPEDFEMFVYDYLEARASRDASAESEKAAEALGAADAARAAGVAGAEDSAANVETGAAGAAGSAVATDSAEAAGTADSAGAANMRDLPEQSHVRDPSPYASRSVGVPRLFANAGASRLPVAMPATKRSIEPVRAQKPSDEGLVLPAGFELREVEGEWVLVETGEAPKEVPLEVHPEHIRMLVGARSYYLYSSKHMTDTYAHWAFLSAEDNPLVTFADCVREDSRVYPRPMAQTSFANPPFLMDAAAVEVVWEQARKLPDYADIKRVEASNGDVYFYSTDYLSDVRAAALVEWDAVERHMNV